MDHNATSENSDKKTLNPGRETWLTGDELILKTGISRTDLIRFIQLKVLPKSMLRISTAGRDGTRKKSYFSSSLVGQIAMLKLLREAGHSIDSIATESRKTGQVAPLSRDNSLSKLLPAVPSTEKKSTTMTAPHFHLPADTIATSAFFVNHDLLVGWIRLDQGNRLSRAIKDEIIHDPTGTVFDIMLRASLKELVFNWQPLFSFTYRFLQATTPVNIFNRLAPMISLNLEASGPTEKSLDEAAQAGPIDSCPICLEDGDGQVQYMRIYGIALAEGTLFVLDEDRRQDVHLDSKAAEPDPGSGADAESASKKIPFSVLSARLDDSRSIVDTLLPETYFQLVTRIWDESDSVLASFGGHRAKRSGTEVQYIIPRHADTDPAYDAIRCAITLRKKIHAIEKSLKADGGWFAAIRLNIGISSGSDHLQPEDLTASMAFMLPGGAADQAFHLSALGHGGAIWITKSAFSHLTPQQKKRITFGIYRDERLIPNIFALVADLPQPPDTPPLERGIRSLSITRIFDLQAERTGQEHPKNG